MSAAAKTNGKAKAAGEAGKGGASAKKGATAGGGGGGASSKATSAASESNGAGANGSADVTTATATANGNGEGPDLIQYSMSSKPSRDEYNGEQDGIKAQIATKQAALDKVRSKIADSNGGGGSGPLAEKRKALRTEQQELRSKTAGFKIERNETLNQLKGLQDNVQKKVRVASTG